MDSVKEVRRAQRSPFMQPRPGILGGPDVLGELMTRKDYEDELDLKPQDKSQTWEGRMNSDGE